MQEQSIELIKLLWVEDETEGGLVERKAYLESSDNYELVIKRNATDAEIAIQNETFDIVIFDEPNSGLDPIMSNAIDELILKMKKELGSTFIVISHDIIGTFNIADYIGMLYNGDFIIFGTKEDVLNSENEIVRDFLKRNLKEIV